MQRKMHRLLFPDRWRCFIPTATGFCFVQPTTDFSFIQAATGFSFIQAATRV